MLEVIGDLVGPSDVEFGDWRAGDQRYYCSDTSELRSAAGWRPRVAPDEGIRRLYEWLCRERSARASASAVSAA